MATPIVSEALLEELYQRGEAIYENQLKEQLEREHNGEYVVIHVDTGDYAVAKIFTLAHREMMRRRLPKGRMYGRKIGLEPDNDSVARRVASAHALHRFENASSL